MSAPADFHQRRGAELLAVLGAARLGALLRRFADDLGGLLRQAHEGADAATLAAGLHRLQGSGSTLGLDSTAAALAEAAALLARAVDAGAVDAARPAVVAALVQAEAGQARGWAVLLADVPEIGGQHPGASKR